MDNPMTGNCLGAIYRPVVNGKLTKHNFFRETDGGQAAPGPPGPTS